MNCKICDQKLTTGVSSHIRKKHNISITDYTSLYPEDKESILDFHAKWKENKHIGIMTHYEPLRKEYIYYCKICGKGQTTGVVFHITKTHKLSIESYIATYPDDKELILQLHKEWKENCSKVKRGKVFTDEHKKNLSIAHIGKMTGNDNPAKQPGVGKKISIAKKLLFASGKHKPSIWDKNRYHSKVLFREDLGHFVRSRWEVNVARCFNHCRIVYEYEPTMFELDNLCYYIPDFYLHDINIWVEVKGWMDETSKYKIDKFRERYPDKSLIVIDEALYKLLILISGIDILTLEVDDIVRSLLKNKEESRNGSLTSFILSLVG